MRFSVLSIADWQIRPVGRRARLAARRILRRNLHASECHLVEPLAADIARGDWRQFSTDKILRANTFRDLRQLRRAQTCRRSVGVTRRCLVETRHARTGRGDLLKTGDAGWLGWELSGQWAGRGRGLQRECIGLHVPWLLIVAEAIGRVQGVAVAALDFNRIGAAWFPGGQWHAVGSGHASWQTGNLSVLTAWRRVANLEKIGPPADVGKRKGVFRTARNDPDPGNDERWGAEVGVVSRHNAADAGATRCRGAIEYFGLRQHAMRRERERK